MKYKVGISSLGCSKNLIDTEIIIGILKSKEFEVTEDFLEADIIIVNTCGFIDKAKEESINTILELGELKTSGICKALIVAGCLSERYREELSKEIPEIDGILGTGNVDEIAEIIELCLSGKKVSKFGNIDSNYNEFIERDITTPNYTAYIKIAEGCDNHCTYCIIPKLRGKYRSRSIESIMKEAEHLVRRGVKEIILIAQDTSKYGSDLYGEIELPMLLDKLNGIKNLEWIRLLYIYPETFTKKLIDAIKRNEKVVNYVDIPIQHINNNILKKMNRSTNREEITNLISKLRSEIPDIVIRTTLIVGFPGEGEEEFNELKRYVEEIKFDRLGVFKYSKEEDTPAAKLDSQVDEDTKNIREKEIMELQEHISYELNMKNIDNKLDVLIEEKIEKGVYMGRTYKDSPEIDGVFYLNSNRELKIGEFYTGKVVDALEYDLLGDVWDEFSK